MKRREILRSITSNISTTIHRSTASRWLRTRKSRFAETIGGTLRRRKMRWVVEIRQPLILISEVQRSGGTLLSQLFDGHPECFSHPGEIYWGRPEKWHWPNLDIQGMSTKAMFNSLHEPWVDAYGSAGYYRKKPGYSTAYPFVFDLTLQRRIFRDQCSKYEVTRQRDAFDAYLTSFFNAWVDYQNLYEGKKKFITGFTPRVLVESDPELFFLDYPDGYIISIIRDPVDWYLSAKKHAFFRRYGDDLEALMKFWTESVNATVNARSRFPDKVLVVSFEKLIQETAVVMSRICRHVGISFSDVLLRPTFNGLDIRSNSSMKSVYGVDLSAAQRSHDTNLLSVEARKRIMEIVDRAWIDAQGVFSKE